MLLTITQAAEKLGISEYQTKKYCESGTLAHLPVSPDVSRRFYRIPEKAVYELKKSLKNNPPPVESKPEPVIPEGVVSVKEAAKRLDVAEPTIFARIARGTLRSIKFNNRTYITLESLASTRARNKKPEPKAPETFVEQTVKAATLPTLTPFANRLKEIERQLTALESSNDPRRSELEKKIALLEERFDALVRELGGV